MKEKLESVKQVLEGIEVRGKDNLRYLLACINTLEDVLLKMKQEKERAEE